MKVAVGFLLFFACLNLARADQVPFPSVYPDPMMAMASGPRAHGDVLPYYTLVNGHWIPAQAQDDCSSTPVTAYRKRYRLEEWNNQFRGGSHSTYSETDSGSERWSSSARAAADYDSAYESSSARASSKAASGSRWNNHVDESYSDWHNNRLRGRIINDDEDSVTFYPCQSSR